MFSRCSRSVCCISSRKTWLLDDFDCWSMICDPTIGIYTCFNHWRLYGFARDSRSQEMLTRIIHINTPRPSSSCFIKKNKAANTVMLIHVHPFSYPPRRHRLPGCWHEQGTFPTPVVRRELHGESLRWNGKNLLGEHLVVG